MNWKGLFNKINEEILNKKLFDVFSSIVCEHNTGYTQNLVLFEDGTLEVYRLRQNESLQAEYSGKALTLYSEKEFDFTDIEGWEGGDAQDYIQEHWIEWRSECLEVIEETPT